MAWNMIAIGEVDLLLFTGKLSQELPDSLKGCRRGGC